MARNACPTIALVVITLFTYGCGYDSASAPEQTHLPAIRSSDDSSTVASSVTTDESSTSSVASMPDDCFDVGAAEVAADIMPAEYDYAAEALSPTESPERGLGRDYRGTEEAAESEPAGEAEWAGRESKRYDDYTPRRQRPQSGLLTAGSTDDHKAFDAYQQFLSDGNHRAPYAARLPIGQRVEIQVTDPQGMPVGDARIEIRHGQQRPKDQPFIEVVTGSDGRTMWLTGLDGGHQSGEVSVTVHSPDGGKPVTQQLRTEHQPWRIVLPRAEASPPTQLDLALVIDTTGSMGDELEYLKSEIDEIATTIHSLFPNVDQRYSLVVYRDQGDQYVMQSHRFTSSLSEFRTTLANQRAAGGGDYPEAVHIALDAATHLDWRMNNTARVLFLVADAPPHDQDISATYDATQTLRSKGIRMFPVAGSGVEWKAEFILRATSFLTMGKYLFLTDHSGVGNAHAAPHVPSYQVEHLNRLMVRMVAEQLAGRELAAEEILAVERMGEPLPVGQRIQQISHRVTPRPVVRGTCVEQPQVAWNWDLGIPARWLWLGLIVCGAFVIDLVRDRSVKSAGMR